MRKHNGMRPQDIVVLLKIITLGARPWQFKDLAEQLALSPAEITESLNRSHMARLVDDSKRRVSRQSLEEFIRYGLPFVFPEIPGTMVNGMLTAHAHPFYAATFSSDLPFVWPDPEGTTRGLAISPLYPKVPLAAAQDQAPYLLLATIDILRVGRARERKMAIEQLQKAFLL